MFRMPCLRNEAQYLEKTHSGNKYYLTFGFPELNIKKIILGELSQVQPDHRSDLLLHAALCAARLEHVFLAQVDIGHLSRWENLDKRGFLLKEAVNKNKPISFRHCPKEPKKCFFADAFFS